MSFDHHDDEEPVAVVRVMADFALCLTLCVLMLIGTNASSEGPALETALDARAAMSQQGAKNTCLSVSLDENGHFLILPITADSKPLSAAALAQHCLASNGTTPITLVVQFSDTELALKLHRGLRNLQSAFGTNAITIQTVPTGK